MDFTPEEQKIIEEIDGIDEQVDKYEQQLHYEKVIRIGLVFLVIVICISAVVTGGLGLLLCPLVLVLPGMLWYIKHSVRSLRAKRRAKVERLSELMNVTHQPQLMSGT